MSVSVPQTPYVSEAHLEFLNLLPLPPYCWGGRHMLPGPDCAVLGIGRRGLGPSRQVLCPLIHSPAPHGGTGGTAAAIVCEAARSVDGGGTGGTGATLVWG